MKHAELEETLRATLAGRADDVTRGPEWAPPAEPVGPARRSGHWLAPLAAAAAVAAVVVSVVTIEDDSGRHSTPPATHQPSAITTRSTPSTAPDALEPLRCTVPLPASWQGAITAGSVSTPGRQVTPLAVDDAGQVLADEDSARSTDLNNPNEANSHDLVLVTAGQVRPLYSVAPPASWAGRRIGTVSTQGDWVALALLVGAASGGQGPEQIELVNTATGAARTVRPTAPGDPTIVLGPAILDGSVYWTEIESGSGRSDGPLYRYDIATGKRTTLAAHATSGPYVAAGTVSWTALTGTVQSSPGRPVLPPGFALAAAIQKASPVLGAGGTSVWQDLRTQLVIRAFRPGPGGPIDVVPRGSGGRLGGLTGRLVWWAGSRGVQVLDLRTGAATRINGAVLTGPGYPVVAAGHTVALRLGADRLAVLDTTALPRLHC